MGGGQGGGDVPHISLGILAKENSCACEMLPPPCSH